MENVKRTFWIILRRKFTISEMSRLTSSHLAKMNIYPQTPALNVSPLP